MDKSDVYFTSFRTDNQLSLLDKLKNLVLRAGIKNIDFNDKFVAIKIHFGEYGNMSYLRADYARVIVDLVKSFNGKPFLTDSNTLYGGMRNNGLDHLNCAYMHGYLPAVTNCPTIIADGIKGRDQRLIDINCQLVKQAKIGSAIADADIILSMSHFKGHEMAGFGGTLKNLGMGSGSIEGKKEMHNEGIQVVEAEMCKQCGRCIKGCGYKAISFKDGKAFIDTSKCVGCARCQGLCKFGAIHNSKSSTEVDMNKKIAEYSLAVVKDKPNFHINFICDVSPCCDCYSCNDLPIINDIGMLASFDPVALDQACVDLVNQQPTINYEHLNHTHKVGDDTFLQLHPNTSWQACLKHAEEIKIGTRQYNLINIDKK